MDSDKELCPSCYGNKIVPTYKFRLYQVCPMCHGAGGRDWIHKAMGKFPEPIKDNSRRDNESSVAYQNIQFLMEEIRRQAMSIGVSVVVHVEDVTHKFDRDCYIYMKGKYKGGF